MVKISTPQIWQPCTTYALGPRQIWTNAWQLSRLNKKWGHEPSGTPAHATVYSILGDYRIQVKTWSTKNKLKKRNKQRRRDRPVLISAFEYVSFSRLTTCELG